MLPAATSLDEQSAASFAQERQSGTPLMRQVTPAQLHSDGGSSLQFEKTRVTRGQTRLATPDTGKATTSPANDLRISKDVGDEGTMKPTEESVPAVSGTQTGDEAGRRLRSSRWF